MASEVDDATQRTDREPHTPICVTGPAVFGAGGVAQLVNLRRGVFTLTREHKIPLLASS